MNPLEAGSLAWLVIFFLKNPRGETVFSGGEFYAISTPEIGLE